MTNTTIPVEQRDITILLGTKKYQEAPAFIDSCIVLGNFIECSVCGRVIGVGLTPADAADDVHTNKTGGWYEGIGKPRNAGYRCAYDLPMPRPTTRRPPVPKGQARV